MLIQQEVRLMADFNNNFRRERTLTLSYVKFMHKHENLTNLEFAELIINTYPHLIEEYENLIYCFSHSIDHELTSDEVMVREVLVIRKEYLRTVISKLRTARYNLR